MLHRVLMAEMRNAYNLQSENLKGRDAVGRIILECMSEK
jgi:hypothetical protein